MCAPRRYAFLVVAVLLVIVAGALSDLGPSVCVDGCADCADCAGCAPAPVPLLLAQPDVEFSEPVATHETPDPVRPSRPEERDVFHVPRQSA